MTTETPREAWQRNAERAARAAGYDGPVSDRLPDDWTPPPPDHKQHKRMPLTDQKRECPACYESTLAWMGRQPRASHARRAYERFCHIYGRTP